MKIFPEREDGLVDGDLWHNDTGGTAETPLSYGIENMAPTPPGENPFVPNLGRENSSLPAIPEALSSNGNGSENDITCDNVLNVHDTQGGEEIVLVKEVAADSLLPIYNHAAVVIDYFNALTTKTPVPNTKPTCDAPLGKLTRQDLEKMSGGMRYSLAEEVTHEDAIESCMASYPSLAALNQSYPGFNQLHLTIVKKILVDEGRWAKGKLFVAAALSIGDLFTDIVMVVEYLGRGERGYAMATLISIFVNLLMQSWVAYIQNRSQSRRRQLKEQLYVWALVKPGVDAWRVAQDVSREEGHTFDAMTELTGEEGQK